MNVLQDPRALAEAVLGGLLWYLPDPRKCWTVLRLLHTLRGTTTMPTLDTELAYLHSALKLAVKVLPGADAAAKDATVGEWFDPKLADLLTKHNVPSQLVGLVVSLFDTACAALIAAELAA